MGVPAANISKRIRCLQMKLSQADRIVKLNIRDTFVVKTTNYDVIMTRSVRKMPI